MPSADIQALVSAAILLLLGSAIVLLSTRRSSMKPAARWAPWRALLAGPVIVNLAWALQFVLLDSGRHPHAVSDALALLPSVQVIGTLAGTPAACGLRRCVCRAEKSAVRRALEFRREFVVVVDEVVTAC